MKEAHPFQPLTGDGYNFSFTVRVGNGDGETAGDDITIIAVCPDEGCTRGLSSNCKIIDLSKVERQPDGSRILAPDGIIS